MVTGSFQSGLLASCLMVGAMCACATPPSPTAQEQSQVDAVLERHIELCGGAEALMATHVTERIGLATVWFGGAASPGEYRACVAHPDRVAISIRGEHLKVADVLRPDGAWSCGDGFESCEPAHPQRADELAALARQWGRELLFEPRRWVEAPRLTRDDRDLLVLARLPEGAVEYRFDRERGLLRERRTGQEATRYEDWREVGPIRLPFRVETYYDGQLLQRIQLTEVLREPGLTAWCAERFEQLPDTP